MEIAKDKPIIFLGMCRKVAENSQGHDLIGVTHILQFPFFPQTIAGLFCLFGISQSYLHSFAGATSIHVKIIYESEERPATRAEFTATLSLESQKDILLEQPADEVADNFSSPFASSSSHATTAIHGDSNKEFVGYQISPILAPDLRIWEPGIINIKCEIAGQQLPLGSFACAHTVPSPLSAAEKAAVASDPNAIKTVLFTFKCNECKGNLTTYAVVDPSHRSAELEATAKFIHDAPDDWCCTCGSVKAKLTFMKLGIHDIFRRKFYEFPVNIDSGYLPLYEKRQIQQLAIDYHTLINSSPGEELVQKFLEENDLLWSTLSPVKIINKPPVLALQKADFGIVSSQKILYLVEIEKPQTLLSTKKGGGHSELQKGIDQIKDWSLVVDEHRQALIDQLRLQDFHISDVQFILIAGLSKNTKSEVLKKLHRNPPAAKTRFLCFDDLLTSLQSLDTQLVKL